MSESHVVPIVEVLSSSPVEFAGSAKGLEKFFRLQHQRVRVGDREDDRIFWKRGDFVVVVAMTADGKIVVLREFKQAVGEVLYGLPAGGVKKDESPLAAGLREMEEESGYIVLIGDDKHPPRCLILGPFFNSPDKSTERHFIAIFMDAVLGPTPPAPEESETIVNVVLLDMETAKQEIKIVLHRLALHEAAEFLA